MRLIIFLLTASPALADLVTFNGGSFSGSGIGLNYTVSDLAAGTDLSGFTATAPGDPGDAFEAYGWTTALSASLDSSFHFTLTPDPTYSFILTDISFSYRPQGSGPQQIGVRLQLGSGPPTLFVPINNDDLSPATDPPDTYKTWDTYQRSGNFQSAPDQSITIYLVGFDATVNEKFLSIDNINVNGTVIPEPSTITLLAVLGASTCVFRLRHHRKNPKLATGRSHRMPGRGYENNSSI